MHPLHHTYVAQKHVLLAACDILVAFIGPGAGARPRLAPRPARHEKCAEGAETAAEQELANEAQVEDLQAPLQVSAADACTEVARERF